MSNFSREEVAFGSDAFEKDIKDVTDVVRGHDADKKTSYSSIMSTIKVAQQEPKTRDPGIQSGDLVLFRLPKGDFKSIKVEKNTCVCRRK